MEKLIYTHQKTLISYKHSILRIILSIATGICTVLCLASCFGVSVNIGNADRAGFLGGMAKCWNDIADTLLLNMGYVLKVAAGAGEDCQVFLLLLSLGVALLVWLILKSEVSWLLLVFPVGISVMSMLWKLTPGLLISGAFLLCMILCWLEIKFWHGISLWQIIFLSVLILAVTGVFSYDKTADVLVKNRLIETVKDSMREQMHDWYYGKNMLEDGMVTDEIRKEGNSKTALTVKMENPEPIYLRGFIGEMYADGQWKHLPYATWQEKGNLFYWLEQHSFRGEGQLSRVISLLEENSATNECQVTVKSADSEYAYVPYEYAQTEEDWHSWYGAYFSDKTGKRLKTYAYQIKEPLYDQWTDLAGAFFTRQQTEEMADYLVDESHYNQFVYSYYTYLSGGDKKIISLYVKDAGDQSQGHVEYKRAIENVRSYLDKNMYYTTQPALENSQADLMLEKIFQQGKGYDVHYATLATMLFRYYGIPARYVEGYLVTPELIDGVNAGSEIKVPMSNIHAWTEIYVDGIGFVPIEMCPAYENLMPEADLTVGITNDVIQTEFQNNFKPPKTLDTLESGEEEQMLNEKLVVVLFSFFFILILLLLGYVVYCILRRIYKNTKRKRLFRSSNRNLAVSAIYAYMEDLKLPIDQKTRNLGNKAAYSREEISKEEHLLMLAFLKKLKVEKRSHEQKK